jgi:hypothetical protein
MMECEEGGAVRYQPAGWDAAAEPGDFGGECGGLLQRMGAFGVKYAEIGFAGANQFVEDLTTALQGVDTGAMKLALFGRTRGRGMRVEDWPDVKFILRHKGRVETAVVVVKSRLLDVKSSWRRQRKRTW